MTKPYLNNDSLSFDRWCRLIEVPINCYYTRGKSVRNIVQLDGTNREPICVGTLGNLEFHIKWDNVW